MPLEQPSLNGSPLEAIDRVASTPDVPIDTSRARDQLQMPGIEPAPAMPPKKKGGWQKGRRRKPEGAQPKRTKAELEEALAAAEARLEELEQPSDDPVSYDQAEESLAGTALMLSGLVEQSPYRALALTEEQCGKLAKLWAPIIGPHMEQLAESMPVAVALLGTAQIMYPKYVQLRQDLTGLEVVPDADPTPAADEGTGFIRPRGVEVLP